MRPYAIDAELVSTVAALPVVDRSDASQARRIMAERIVASGRYNSPDAGVTTENHSFQAIADIVSGCGCTGPTT